VPGGLWCDVSVRVSGAVMAAGSSPTVTAASTPREDSAMTCVQRAACQASSAARCASPGMRRGAVGMPAQVRAWRRHLPQTMTTVPVIDRAGNTWSDGRCRPQDSQSIVGSPRDLAIQCLHATGPANFSQSVASLTRPSCDRHQRTVNGA
jgi:hypothetical protein